MEPALSKNETPNEDVEIFTGELDQEGPDYSSESDLLFRTQMRIADAFYAHWKKGLAGLVAFWPLFWSTASGLAKKRLHNRTPSKTCCTGSKTSCSQSHAASGRLGAG